MLNATTLHLGRPARIAWGMVEQALRGASAQGQDIAAILRRAGLDGAGDDQTLQAITPERFAALTRTLRRVMRDEMWGLCRHPVPPGTFASACVAAVHCDTLREAIQMMLAHYRRHLKDFTPRLHVHGCVAEIRLQAQRWATDELAEAALTVFTFHALQFAWWLTGQRFALLELSFVHAPLAGDDAGRLFNVPCLYRQPHSAFLFAACWLDLPVTRARGELTKFLRAAPMPLPEKPSPHSSVGDRVRAYLRQRLTGQSPSRQDVAQALRLSPTSLMRRLQDEGMTFKDLKDNLRKDVSTHYLQSSGLPVEEIAYRVGFSEPATFCRAFKKWTGMTPSSYRGQHATRGHAIRDAARDDQGSVISDIVVGIA